MRDNFPKSIIETLAKRVAYRCSNPNCQQLTSGPSEIEDKSVNIGVAAHISAASKGGPRFNADMSHEERCSINNGIWLCQNCAKLIDNDSIRYTVESLIVWKSISEGRARISIEFDSKNIRKNPYRMSHYREEIQETTGELVTGVTSRARGSRWARSEMTRAVGTLPSWPGRG